MTCPACGTRNPPGFRFCGSCGQPMERPCPSCGVANPAGFRFCGSCGSPVDPATGPVTATVPSEPPAELEERKVVTVLFADLTGSTELASRFDPEDLRGILRPFFEAMVEEIDRFGGTVEKFIGDAIVAVFGVPVAHEDDPERAVRTALAMQRRLEALNPLFEASHSVRLAMRIGVNTGEVVTATGIDREGLVTGEPVNIAARFETLAAPGAIVVGDRTRRDTRHAVDYRSLGEVSVKGVGRPLGAWEVIGEWAQQPTAGSVAVAPMVGRDHELELLNLIQDRTVREGRPNLVTVVGPAGIGKSRLTWEFARSVERRGGMRVVRGRCLPYGKGLTYWPLAEILKSDAGILDSDPPATIRDKAGAHLGTRFSAEADATGTTEVLLSSIGVELPTDPLSGVPVDVAKEQIARSWRTYFESMAAQQPVLTVIEDLHWADASLLDLVEGLVTRMGGPILFVCPARPTLTERRPTWGGGLGNATSVVLSPLTERDSQSLVRHILGEEAPSEVVEAILTRSEGNPFFAQELLQMLTEDGTLLREHDGWRFVRPVSASLPDTVQGVIAGRIDMLPAEEKRVLQDASVIGRVFWRGALERLGVRDADSHLDRLVDKGLVYEREGSVIEGERELIFNHILTRDVAHGSIPRARRAAAHAEAGRWTEEVTRGRAEEFAEILAYHFDLAGDRERTARYSMLAGHRSRRVFAAEEAIGWYDRAIETALTLPEQDGSRIVAEAARARGEAAEQLGRFERSLEDYERSLETSRAAGDGLLEARALAAIAHVLRLLDRYEEATRLLPEALAKAREVGATDIEAHLLYTSGTIQFGRGAFAEALRYHQEALRVSEDAGDRLGQAFALHGMCESQFFLGPFQTAVDAGLRCDALLRELGQRPMIFHNAYMVGWGYWLIGRFDQAEAWVQASVRGNQELGNRLDEGFSMTEMGALMLSLGRLGEAKAAADRGVALGIDLGTPRLELACRTYRIPILVELGAFDELAAELEVLEQLPRTMGSTFFVAPQAACRAWVQLRAGDRAGATTSFHEATAGADGILNDSLWVWRLRIQALLDPEAGPADPAELREAGDALLALAEGESPPFTLWALLARATAEARSGDWTAALETAVDARARADRLPDRSFSWRAGALAGDALERVGRPDDAAAGHRATAEDVRAIASTIEDARYRISFLGRPDVARVLAVGGKVAPQP